jgi:tyrosine-protein kinase Etk/Wzc
MKSVSNRGNRAEEEESGIGQQVVTKYMPYWPLFIITSLLALAAAYVYLRYTTPMFEAAATMIIKDDSKGSDDASIVNELNRLSTKKKVENEMQVLQSRVLMESVVKRLSLYAPVTQQGKVKEADGYTLSPITIEKENPDSVVLADKVYFSYDKNSQTVLLNDKDRYPINQFVATPFGSIRFTLNKYYSPTFDAERKLYFSLGDPRIFADGLTHGLKISSNRQSAIIDLSYRDAIPQRAVNILGELIKVYEESSINDENTLAKNTLSFLDERLGVLKKDIDSIEKKIQQYKSGAGAVNISAQGDMALQNMSANTQKIGDYNNQLAMLSQIERSVVNRSSSDAIAPSAVNDPALAGMMGRLYTAQMEYNTMRQTMGEQNPLLLAKAEEINKLQPGILENIRTQKSAISAAAGSLSSSNGGYNAILSTVPKKEKDLLEISREHSTKSQSYNYLLQKKQETEMGLLSVAPKTKVVDKPLAGQFPVSPKKKLIYLMALVGALGFCVALITIKDTFTGKIKYRAEIEKMTAIPIIGEIAFDKSKTPLVIEKGTRSFIAEEFRKLRISLSFLGVDSTHRKLLVTSSISGEGKSFVGANLAVSISLTGKKVVLVDMDLNNPTQSKILGVDHEFGVTELLTGEKTVDEVIHKVEGQENLYFISPGSLPENPTELLANGKVKSIIDYLDKNFDMVVIDTSPAVLVTDAFILSNMCDATLYVIRHDYTPKMLVKRIDENNEINPIHNPAIIFNGVKSRGIIKNNYGYGYDYVYGNKNRSDKTKKVS